MGKPVFSVEKKFMLETELILTTRAFLSESLLQIRVRIRTMILKNIRLINYRNIAFQDIHLHPHWNLFYGANAQGKTNILESIFLTARGRSFRNAPDRDLVRFGERSAYVLSDVERKGRDKRVEVKISRVERKRIRVNEVEMENTKELAAQFEVVLFAPENLIIVKGSPGERRAFLDDLLRAVDPTYGVLIRTYDKVLSQRNSLLKSHGDSWFDRQLSTYDDQLAQAGSQILWKRKKMVKEIRTLAPDFQAALSSRRENLELTYQSELLDGEDTNKVPTGPEKIRNKMKDLLFERREEDRSLGHTSLGPHKDDLVLTLNGLYSRSFASQGQARTITLALKLSELKIIEKYKDLHPLLLLDDVFSELDGKRSAFLLETIGPYQTILTSNHLVEGGREGMAFQVEKGRVHANNK